MNSGFTYSTTNKENISINQLIIHSNIKTAVKIPNIKLVKFGEVGKVWWSW